MSAVRFFPFAFLQKKVARVLIACGLAAFAAPARANPFADAVVSYNAGTGASPTYLYPNAALGAPARFTGTAFGFPSVVSMFSPPFDPDQIVSIGRGGQLTVRFDQPVTNDASHLYGVDLIVFGNTGFVDSDYPNGRIGSPPGLFGAGNARVEVSADGVSFVPVSPAVDALFPTQGYLDGGPYDATAGGVPTDFLKPINPALTLSSFGGLSYAQALALYDGSGGGTPIDIAEAGLSSVSFVRVSIPADVAGHAEIDALAAVPEPSTVCLLISAVCLAPRRNRVCVLQS